MVLDNALPNQAALIALQVKLPLLEVLEAVLSVFFSLHALLSRSQLYLRWLVPFYSDQHQLFKFLDRLRPTLDEDDGGGIVPLFTVSYQTEPVELQLLCIFIDLVAMASV